MNVGDLMTRDVKTCRSHDSLDRAARIMWDHDCGCVPVVDANGKAVGMITDRDVCMALSMSDLTRRVHTGHHRKDSLSVDALVKTMSAICRPAAAASHAHTAE